MGATTELPVYDLYNGRNMTFLLSATETALNVTHENYSKADGVETWTNPRMTLNFTTDMTADEEREYIFDRTSVRAVFILLYTIVFCFCFFGNLLVILVVTLHWRMRNITKFCLANLAFADLCVGVFCVYQNLSTYLINSWVLGEFLCKMYQFINALSHTASILIMVVMCAERHLAIQYPFRSKQILTIRRLRILIITVWIISAIYCSPRLYYIVTLKVYKMDGGIEIICTAKRTLYDSRTFDMIHFFLLFLLPLFIITILYTQVGITLWRTSKNRLRFATSATTESNISNSSSESLNDESPTTTTISTAAPSLRHKSLRSRTSGSSSNGNNSTQPLPSSSSSSNSTSNLRHVLAGRCSHILRRTNSNKSSRRRKNKSSPSFVVTIENKCHVVGPEETTVVEIDPDGIVYKEERNEEDDHQRRLHLATSSISRTASADPGKSHHNSPMTNSDRRGMSIKRTKSTKRLSTARNLRDGREAIRSRQTVVRMLIVIVVTFAVCNFPFHLRKMFQYWWPNYDYVSVYSTLATPLTHLIMYSNCAINPIIYAFMSKTFRSSFRDLLCCRWKKPFQSSNHRQLSVRAATVSVIGDGCQD